MQPVDLVLDLWTNPLGAILHATLAWYGIGPQPQRDQHDDDT